MKKAYPSKPKIFDCFPHIADMNFWNICTVFSNNHHADQQGNTAATLSLIGRKTKEIEFVHCLVGLY